MRMRPHPVIGVNPAATRATTRAASAAVARKYARKTDMKKPREADR
jgi:hypothetical protein